MNYPEYSVLMSVYKNEKAENLRLSMNSMWNQTVQTNDFVLICDGPLTADLNMVIGEMEIAHPDALRVIRFPENHGLGYALRTGVNECKNEIIARMDSDDISYPERCEKELNVLMSDPELSIVGSIIEEFTETVSITGMPASVNSRRVVPEHHEEILQFARKRNPFNHPSVMFRRQAVLDAGNYQDIRYMQDYYLWVHMLLNGARGYNIQEPLVWMRADSNLFKRRSGKLYRQIQLDLFRYMKEQGFITRSQYMISCILRAGSSMAPSWLREFMFKKVLRK
ncbi:MAG: glycosyltransferase [Solobacterium sp.]|nr:glycosyltransferase [Solobacterium sp.]